MALLYQTKGRPGEAEPLLKDALAMTRRLLTGYAKGASEGEVLNFATTHHLTRDGLLSVASRRAAREPAHDAAAAYPAVWAAKGTVARVVEHRHLQARAAPADPAVARQFDQLAEARRRRAELLLAPATTDPETRKAREADLTALDERLAALARRTAAAFAPVARLDRLDAATSADLQRALPADAALVDYVRYNSFTWDEARPASQRQVATPRYAAFVVTREKVA